MVMKIRNMILGIALAICLLAGAFSGVAEEGLVLELEPVDLTGDVYVGPEEAAEAEAVAVEAGLALTEEVFPDEAFRDYVLEKFDRNDDGTISSSEASKVKTIDVTGLGISSLEGVEKFTKLNTLLCAGNALTELNIGSNKSLKTLDCSDNELTALNLNANKSLTTLLCAGNAIGEVDLGTASKLKKYLTTVKPVTEDDALLFNKVSGKKTTTVMSLPAGTKILQKGKLFYNPEADFELISGEESMGVKQKLKLIPEDSAYPAAFVSFYTSNKKVATVSASGEVKAVKAGSVTITALPADGEPQSCEITVLAAPTKVTLSDTKLSLGEGQTYALEAAVQPTGAMELYTWKSSKPAVATVEEGELEALKAGKTTITVKAYNGKSAKCTLTVYAAPTSMTLSDHEVGLMEGQSHTLKVQLSKGAGGVVELYSDAPEIADIDPRTGKVTAKAVGTAVIHAETYNHLQDECVVSVMEGPAEIIMDREEAFLYVSDTLDLGAVALSRTGQDVTRVLTYKSSSDKVATVDGAGTVKGVKAGTVTITASAANGVKATRKVVVGKLPTSVKLNKTSLSLKYDEDEMEGETYTLKATLNSGAVSDITFESSDEDVAYVYDSGEVEAVGIGTAVITATTVNGKHASCTVKVTAAKGKTNPSHGGGSYDYDGETIIVAHRGGMSYANENTLEAFESAQYTGARMIELDARTTKDKIQVVNHDPEIKGDNGKKYKIKSYTYEYLADKKSDLCTLDEALALISETDMLLQLELKDTADPAQCVQLVKKYGMEDRTYYISFEMDLLKKVRKLDASAKLGFIFSGSVPSKLNSYLNDDDLNLSALMVKYDLLTETRLNEWQSRGLKINVWTVDSATECRRWANMGVDFITSNYPERAYAAIS